MDNDNNQAMIERYKRELLEFNRKNNRDNPADKRPMEPQKAPIQQVVGATSNGLQNPMPNSQNPPSEMREEANAIINKLNLPLPKAGSISRMHSVEPSAPVLPSKTGDKADAMISNLPPPFIDSDESNGSNETPKTESRETPAESLDHSNEEPSQAVGENMSLNKVKLNTIGSYGSQQHEGTAPIPVYINRQYNSMEECKKENTQTGFLTIHVFAMDPAHPVTGARVIVYCPVGGEYYTFYDVLTDNSGKVSNLTLPAPDKNRMQKQMDTLPYAAYNVHVDHPKFERTACNNVPIFEGIESIQPVRMLPKT